MKRKWWLIPIGLILALALTAAFFWQTVLLYAAPNIVLAAALKDRLSELETRISSTPLPILVAGMDSSGRNRIDLELLTYSEVIGPVQYDMKLQMEQMPRRILANGRVAFQGREMDLAVFLDQNFAAISSDGMLSGNYYGLHYDTFSQDLRSNKWITLLMGESAVNSLESKISSLQEFMQGSIELPQIAGIDFKSLAMGVLALDPDVERFSADVTGAKETYYVISYETTGAQIALGMEYLHIDNLTMPNPEEEVTISFWLKDRKICRIAVEADNRGADIYWGIAPAATVAPDDIYMQFYDGGNFRTVTVHSVHSGDVLEETITYTADRKSEFFYRWDPSSGDLSVTADTRGETMQLALNLKPTDTGFTVKTEDFGALIYLLFDAKAFNNSPCTMTVTKGTAFETPEYKNFTDCTLEDLLTLLSGVGSLIGIKMP